MLRKWMRAGLAGCTTLVPSYSALTLLLPLAFRLIAD